MDVRKRLKGKLSEDLTGIIKARFGAELNLTLKVWKRFFLLLNIFVVYSIFELLYDDVCLWWINYQKSWFGSPRVNEINDRIEQNLWFWTPFVVVVSVVVAPDLRTCCCWCCRCWWCKCESFKVHLSLWQFSHHKLFTSFRCFAWSVQVPLIIKN